jgi:hypothetical protein
MFVEGRKHQVPQTWVIKPKNVGNGEKITPRKGTRDSHKLSSLWVDGYG